MNACELHDLLAEIERARNFLLYRGKDDYADALNCWSKLSELAIPARLALRHIEVQIEQEPQA